MSDLEQLDDEQLIEELLVALRLQQTDIAHRLTTEVVRRGLTERAFALAEARTRAERRRLGDNTKA